MQQVNQLLNVRNLPAESLPDTQSLMNLSEKQGPKWKLYVSSVTRMVLRTINLANAPALTETELGLRVKDWADFLWPHVPDERLQECFDRAAGDHDGSFPLSAYEIRNAWRAIQIEDGAKAAAEKERMKESNPVDHCKTKYRHINEQGEIDILYGGPGGIEAIVPCPFCRMEANAQAVANLAERLAKQQSNTKLRAI
jgi:hypothetical protein